MKYARRIQNAPDESYEQENANLQTPCARKETPFGCSDDAQNTDLSKSPCFQARCRQTQRSLRNVETRIPGNSASTLLARPFRRAEGDVYNRRHCKHTAYHSIIPR